LKKERTIDLKLHYPTQDTYFDTVSNFKKNGTTVVLFGSGAVGVEALHLLQNVSCAVSFFCDNNSEKDGTQLKSIPIIGYCELKSMIQCNQNIAVIPSLAAQDEVIEQMTADGLQSFIYPLDLWNWEPVEQIWDYYQKNLPSVERVYNMLADDLSKETMEVMLNYRIGHPPSPRIFLRCRNISGMIFLPQRRGKP
jgi:hypothetical protein